MSKEPRFWHGEESHCNLCDEPLKEFMVDGLVRGRSWAIMCDRCHMYYGVGLGTGLGQRYKRVNDPRWGQRWLKMEG